MLALMVTPSRARTNSRSCIFRPRLAVLIKYLPSQMEALRLLQRDGVSCSTLLNARLNAA